LADSVDADVAGVALVAVVTFRRGIVRDGIIDAPDLGIAAVIGALIAVVAVQSTARLTLGAFAEVTLGARVVVGALRGSGDCWMQTAAGRVAAIIGARVAIIAVEGLDDALYDVGARVLAGFLAVARIVVAAGGALLQVDVLTSAFVARVVGARVVVVARLALPPGAVDVAEFGAGLRHAGAGPVDARAAAYTTHAQSLSAGAFAFRLARDRVDAGGHARVGVATVFRTGVAVVAVLALKAASAAGFGRLAFDAFSPLVFRERDPASSFGIAVLPLTAADPFEHRILNAEHLLEHLPGTTRLLGRCRAHHARFSALAAGARWALALFGDLQAVVGTAEPQGDAPAGPRSLLDARHGLACLRLKGATFGG
jgi:hypothetical protein